jgi:hypothetical protein
MYSLNTRIIFSLIFGSFILISACKKSAEPLSYTKEYPEMIFTVDTTSSTGDMLLGSQIVQTDVVNYLSENGFTVNNLKSVKVSSIEIGVLSPGKTLDFFKKLEVRLSNQGAGNVIFASKELPDSFTETSTTITPLDVDLAEYFKQGELQFSFYGRNDLQILPDPIQMRVKVNVQVDARLGN